FGQYRDPRSRSGRLPDPARAQGQRDAEPCHVEFLRIRRHQRDVAVPALRRLILRRHLFSDSAMTDTRALMSGKRGLIMGVANDHSIAWGIARTLAAHGAELAFTYQGDAFGRRVKPLADSVGAKLLLPCDVEDVASVDGVFAALEKEWGKIDFIVHAIGFSDKNELKGRYADTTRDNFVKTMVI